ncbi:hypothetical protein AeMF1_012817 [Aphanomyces euteiches]|nr:hypothetical protein AeMF1_012817 [Aphanomyces euteiches]KAH9185341.1 hypothetical protein AeNC1_012679 [Aphanomyces euteiches]
MVIYNRRRIYSIAVAALLVCTGVHGQDNTTTTPAPIITPAVTPAPPVTTEATTTVAPTPPPATTTAAPPPSAAPTTTAPPETAAPPPPPPKPEPSSAAPTNAPSASASPVVTPAPTQTQAPSSSSSSPTAAPSSTAASNTPAPSKSSEPTAVPSSQTSTDAPTTAASVAPTTGSPVDAPLATSSDSTDGSSAATPPSALGSSADSPSSPSAAIQQAAESKSGGGIGLTIALASTAVGVVALVMAVVLVRRRMQQMEDDDAKHVERIDDSMVFMQSTRPSSVPILQSQPRKANNSRTVPTGRTLSVRDPLEPSYPAAVPMVQTTHVPEVGGKSFRGSLPRISEAANSNSDASSNDSHIVDMRATEDLCRFTENTTREPSFSGESYHEDDEGFDCRYLSDMTRETGGWSIDEGSEMSHGEVATAANAVRSTEDLLQSTRSMISIDDASARGSTEVWLDSSRFNAMVSTDVHIF